MLNKFAYMEFAVGILSLVVYVVIRVNWKSA